MQTVTELEIPRGKARSLISQFESKTSTHNNATASVTEVSSKITQIESLIGTYTSYNRDKHVSLHGKIVDLLLGLNNETSKYNVYKLKELHASVKKLIGMLDEKLPGEEIRKVEKTKSEGKPVLKSMPNDPFKFIRSSEPKEEPKKNIEEEKKEEEIEDVVDGKMEPKIEEKPVSVSTLRGFFEKLSKENDLGAQKNKPVMRSKSTTSLLDSKPKKPLFGRTRSISVSNLNSSQDDSDHYVPRFSVTNNYSEEETEESQDLNSKTSDSGFEEKQEVLDHQPSVYESTTDFLTPNSSEPDDYDEEEYQRMLANNNIDDEPIEVEKRVINYEEPDEAGSESDDNLSQTDSLDE